MACVDHLLSSSYELLKQGLPLSILRTQTCGDPELLTQVERVGHASHPPVWEELSSVP